MPLTPADVHNVAFKKPPIGKRGYDEEEVDAFLDLVEVELSGLIEDNNQLRAGILPPSAPEQPAPAEQAAPQGTSPEDAAALEQLRQHNGQLGEHIAALESQLQQAQAALAEAQQAAEQAQQQAAAAAAAPAPAAEAPAGPPAVDHSHAVKVLALAQQTADQHVAEATAEAQKMVGEARQTADQLLADTKAATEKQVNEARAAAEKLDQDSKAQATATIQDAEQRRNTIISQLEQQRDALTNRLEELRVYEREYRTRLKSYLESQLRELDSSTPVDEEQEQPQS